MSIRDWLARLQSYPLSPKTMRRRRRQPVLLGDLRDWLLEDRCLLSAGVLAPEPISGWASLNAVMWDGGTPLTTPGGIPNLSAPPMKTVTFQNPTDQTIYPFFRDANSGLGAGAGGAATPYDPQDFPNQEYRLYVGYVQNGNDYLGLLPHSSITVRVPLVFWNAENTYIATDGSNLIPTQSGQANPFAYDPSAVRGISPIISNPADGYWVTSFTSDDPTATAGFVMLYRATTPLTPALDAPSQLAEFTIRDPFLKALGITDPADTQVLIDYDVSYVDNALAPITVEASAVPVQIPTNPYSPEAPNPPAPPYGWTGSSLTFSEMQTDIQNFYNNTTGSAAYLGQYFTNPNSPPPPPGSPPPSAPGWPAYYASTLIPSSTKIPAGQNIFLQSPLNGTTSSVQNFYMLTSGGTDPFTISPGGQALGTAQQTVLPLTFPPAQRNTLAADLQSMLQTGPLNLALATNPNNTLGQVTAYYPSGKLSSFLFSPGAGYKSNAKYTLSGGGLTGTATGTAFVNASKGTISRVGLPHYNSGGLPSYTSTPSLTLTGGDPTTPSVITPYISGKLLGIAVVNGGTGYTPNSTLNYKLSGGGATTSATGTLKVNASGAIKTPSFPNYKAPGGPIYTSTPSLTITGNVGNGTGAQVYADIGGGTAVVTLNTGTSLPTKQGLSYDFTRPATDYAATDITNLWYTWAQYYINYFKDFQGESVQGTLNLTGTAAKKNQAAYIAVKNTDLTGLATPLAVGMTVSGTGITPAAMTKVSVVNIQLDSNPDYTDFYLSQLPLAGTTNPTAYTFGPPQVLPYTDPHEIKTITVTNGGTGYVPPLTVSISGGNGAGATAVINSNDITNGQITNIEITNAGGNYTFAPTVTITGGGGKGATAKAVISNGQLTGFKDIVGGSKYTLGTTVKITGGNGQATATAIVDPKTGAVTGIRIINPGSGFSQTSQPNVMIQGGNGDATATATVGTYVSTYANLLPAPNTMLQGGTVLQFAGSVYEALEAEASIPPAQSLSFYNTVMPPPVGLVGTTIGSDLGDLPNSNGGASVLGGQVRDLIKSVLRGVWNFEQVPESTQNWYPNPSKTPVSTLPFNPFNLDPYVWFIHDVLGMSGYGFSTDDDIANVGAFTSPYATDPSKTVLPNNVVISYGGTDNLPQKQQWFPGVPWGVVQSSGKVTTTSGGKAFVTLAPGGKPTPTQITQYYQVIPVTPGQSGGAYVIGPGIPAGTTINIQNQPLNLSFSLNVPNGEKVTSSGGIVNLTFTGNPFSPLLPPSPPPVGNPPPVGSPPPASSAPPTVQSIVQLAQDEAILTIDQFVALADAVLGITPAPTLESSIAAYQDAINANPADQTLLGQVVINLIFSEILQLIMQAPPLPQTGAGPSA